MMKWKKGAALLMAAGILTSAMPMNAFAATKYISSISLRVHAELEAGDSISDGDNISTEKTDSGSYVYTSGSRYRIVEAEWANDKDLSVGDKPKMYVWLEIDADDSNNTWKFRSSYSSSTVSVSGGEYVSSSKSGDDLKLTIRVNGIKGDYDPPENAEWGNSIGRATWDAGDDEGSGYYDVYLYRGSSAVKKVEDYKGTSYNFYPYMTKEGDYTFKVRTVPHTDDEKEYGKRSEWTESDDLYIDENEVSDGTGQTSDDGSGSSSTGGTVGWYQSGDIWYFRYPNGVNQTNGWLKWNDKWYLFNTSGQMLTGWQKVNNIYYYMSSSGDMKTGWVQSGGKWYYCNPNADGPEGAMIANCWLTINGLTYYIEADGSMAEGWREVQGNYYYFQPSSGQKLVNTTVDGFKLDANGIWIH